MTPGGWDGGYCGGCVDRGDGPGVCDAAACWLAPFVDGCCDSADCCGEIKVLSTGGQLKRLYALTATLGERAVVGEASVCGHRNQRPRKYLVHFTNAPARVRCGDDATPGTASDNAGESYDEPSTGAADVDAAEDMTGLVNDG